MLRCYFLATCIVSEPRDARLFVFDSAFRFDMRQVDEALYPTPLHKLIREERKNLLSARRLRMYLESSHTLNTMDMELLSKVRQEELDIQSRIMRFEELLRDDR